MTATKRPVATSEEIYRELGKIIPNMPDKATEVRIILRQDQAAVIEARFFAETREGRPEHCERYLLEKLEPDRG